MLSKRNLCRVFSTVATIFFIVSCARAGEAQSLDMGIFPYFSTRALLDLYQPMRAYLARELGQPINLFTALSFKAYADQTRVGAYDILVTPPHFARLAQRESGYIPLTVYTRELRAVVVVSHRSTIHNLQDLRGKTIAMPNRLALVAIMGQHLLQNVGLRPEDVSLLEMPTHNTAVLAVQRGEVEAAITERVALTQMPEALRQAVRIIAQAPAAPHVMILAHPRLGAARIESIKRALLNFPGTREGRQFFNESGFEGLRLVNDSDLRTLDPYQKELRRLLEMPAP